MPGHTSRKATVQTTEHDLPIKALTTDGSGEGVFMTSTNLSKMNNRLYRQCRDYTVSFSMDGIAVNSSTPVEYQFYTLPHTWFVKGAIKHAYNTYMQMMADELNQGVKMAKWHDFMINEQNPDGVYDYMVATLFDGQAWANLTADESITDSTVTDTGGTSQGFHLIGNLANSYNIFREYAKLLNYGTPDDESVSSSQPYDGLLDLDDADVLAERGDRAPYDRDFTSFLPADTTVDDDQDQNILVLRDYIHIDRDGAGAARSRTRQFTAPLGLVWIQKEDNGSGADFSTSEPELICHVAPGSYKGVKSTSLV